VSAETDALMSRARRSLTAARLLLEAGSADFAASRAYYAMFYAAEALLLTRGLAFSKHGAVIAEFAREFVRSGEFAAEYGRALREALEERIVADYHMGDEFPASRGQHLLARAEAFVAAAQAFLDRPSQ
jgi:uncharacterized protein (UPF0332 family)